MIRYLVIIALIALPFVASKATEFNENDSNSPELLEELNGTYQRKDDCLGKCLWWKPYYRLPHTDCNKYCRCIFGFVKVKACKHDYTFSASKGRCVHQSSSAADCVPKASCIGKCPANLPPDAVLLLHHHDCKKFCICRTNSVEIMNCPDDFIFDDDTQICRPPQEAKCNRPSSG